MSTLPGSRVTENSAQPSGSAVPPSARTPTIGAGEPPSRPPNAILIVVIVLIGLLMVFSLVAALLDQTTLAVMAGTTAVGLVGEVIRQVLAGRPSTKRPRSGRRRRGRRGVGPSTIEAG